MTRRFSTQFAAFALSALVTLATLGSVDHLATSQPPAGPMAQMAHLNSQV